MKRAIIALTFIGVLFLLVALPLYPSAGFESVRRPLWKYKQEAFLIRDRIMREHRAGGKLTPEEEKNGWKCSSLADGGFILERKLFIWSRLEMDVPAQGTFTWKYFPAPFVCEYLHVAP